MNMKYLCLIYADPSGWERLSPEQRQEGMAAYMAYGDGLKKSNHYVMSQRLQPPSSATVVRVRDGKVSTTDGPFIETKEQLGGYYLIQAADLNEAIQVAARCPGAQHGSVEVRPLAEM
jgi:hypothetical protein